MQSDLTINNPQKDLVWEERQVLYWITWISYIYIYISTLAYDTTQQRIQITT